VITLASALQAARQTLSTVTRRTAERGYYSGAHTEIINSHAEMRAALDMLIKAAEQTDPPAAGNTGPAEDLPFVPCSYDRRDNRDAVQPPQLPDRAGPST
jgi:hypothetical protein